MWRRRRRHVAVLLLFSLILAEHDVAFGDQSWWYAASPSYVDPNNTIGQYAEFDQVTLIACVSLANDSPWTEMFCHQNGRCVLSDRQVDGRYHDPANVFETECWTKYAPPPCFPPFSDIPDVGCIYLNTSKMAWHDARILCRGYGGDLVVPEDYGALVTYFTDSGINDIWVGVYKEKWVDGSQVTSWGSGEPDGPPQNCARILMWNSVYQLCDAECTSLYASICQLR